MSRRAWVGTIALHAMLIAAVAWCVPERAVPEAMTAAVEIFAPPAPTPTPSPTPSPSRVSVTAAAPVAAKAPGRRAGGRRGPRGPVVADVESEIRAGGDGGSGNQKGQGQGQGQVGLGAASGAETVREIPTPPPVKVAPPKPKSRARPARLIWPVRNRPETEGEVFVVHLKISADGYVTGVRMVKGTTRHANAKAEEGAWRFRYDPARNDAGEPIASELEQKLMIE